jgi:hypothetical protein
LSRLRIFIEHAIGGMKRYNILVHPFRNRKSILRTMSSVSVLGCGTWFFLIEEQLSYGSSSSRALASWRSAVSKPSVNQP